MDTLILVAIVAFLLYRAVRAIVDGYHAADLYCITCGHQGEPETHTKGSVGIELVLWLCLLVPGLIYSIWRLSSREQVCSSCGANTLVPAGSPVAIKMRKDLA